MSFSDDERYPMIFEVAEAGALIQRHLGPGGIYAAIDAAEEFLDANTDDVDDAELADPDDTDAWVTTTRASFLVGFARGLSEDALRRIPPEELRAGLRAVS